MSGFKVTMEIYVDQHMTWPMVSVASHMNPGFREGAMQVATPEDVESLEKILRDVRVFAQSIRRGEVPA